MSKKFVGVLGVGLALVLGVTGCTPDKDVSDNVKQEEEVEGGFGTFGEGSGVYKGTLDIERHELATEVSVKMDEVAYRCDEIEDEAEYETCSAEVDSEMEQLREEALQYRANYTKEKPGIGAPTLVGGYSFTLLNTTQDGSKTYFSILVGSAFGEDEVAFDSETVKFETDGGKELEVSTPGETSFKDGETVVFEVVSIEPGSLKILSSTGVWEYHRQNSDWWK